MGGAGRWIESLARHLPAVSNGCLKIAGVALVPNSELLPPRDLEESIRRHSPVFDGDQAAARLAEQSDVLLAWGLRSLDPVPEAFAGPIVFVGHGHCSWTVDLVRRCLPRTTHWAAVSHSAAQSFPVPSQVTVLHNGIETAHCQPYRSRAEVRESWGLEESDIAVGYVGRLSPEKNVRDVVRAVAELGRPYRAVIIGDGWMRNQILSQCRQILPDLICPAAFAQIGDALHALDSMMLVSPSEGFSLALAEAWYCGLPTVATPVGAIPDVEPVHGQLSVTVPLKATPPTLAAAVRQSLAPGNFPVVDRAARVVRDYYTAEAMAQRWADWLLSITMP